MTDKGLKRHRAADEESYASCPFEITRLLPAPVNDTEQGAHNGRVQISPFSPQGRFRTSQSMDLQYFVQPWKAWAAMGCYNKLVRK